MTRINNYTLLIFTTRDSLPNYAAVANSEVQEMIDLPSFSMTCQNNDQFNEINNPKTVFDKLTAVLNTRRKKTRRDEPFIITIGVKWKCSDVCS